MTLLKQSFPNISAIIPAAGIGSRINSDLPKQYLTIGNKTILEHSVYLLFQQSCICEIIIVINSKDHWYYKLPISKNPKVNVAFGGKTRTDSVMAGLNKISSKNWILIHDAVRPFLHKSDLYKLLSITNQTKIGGLLATPINDTIKKSHYNKNYILYTVNRKNLWRALTPQIFSKNILKSCLKKIISEDILITDESSALEYYGYSPILVKGRSDNIKITLLEDLYLANLLFLDNINKEFI